MNTQDIQPFKEKLLAEKIELEQELASIGKRDANSPGGWDATSGGMETDPADDNELADKFEEIEDNTGIAKNLEKQLSQVDEALSRIEAGKYGICSKGGEVIEKERLEANPSATTCMRHSK